MTTSELGFDAVDGTRLLGWVRKPDGEPLGVIALVHGLGEHSGRYAHLTAFWAERGFASVGVDLRGHGRSEGARGHVPSYDVVMDDISRFLQRATAAVPNVPVVLYGHSMGGNLVLNYAIRRQPALAAIVATSPYLRLAFEPPAWRLAMARALRRVVPSLGQSTGLNTEALSRDPEVIARYLADPLVHSRITIGAFLAIHEAAESIVARGAELPAPTLVVHGSDDRITSVEGSRAFVAGSQGKAELHVVEGARHETHNEPDWKETAAFVIEWIRAVVSTASR